MVAARIRKLALTAHVTSSVGWLGAVAAFLALATVGVTSRDLQKVRAVCLAMDLVVWNVILPMALASFVTGLISSLATSWGLFRHYWIVAKLLLTLAAIGVLLVQLKPIGELALIVADPTASLGHFREARRPMVHAMGGLVLLVVIQVLGIYKPRGLTRYGRCKQEQPAAVAK
jgi:hypothetical protein